MQRTKLQNFIFTVVMAFVMVYGLVCYNIAIDKGGMSNEIFLIAFHEMPIMWPIAVILEMFVFEKLAIKLAFRFVRPGKDNEFMVTAAISSMIVALMCPTMSLIATVLFAHPGSQIVAVWLQKYILNFPMAFFWQTFIAGPLVRNIFKVFENVNNVENEEKQAA